MNIQTNDDGTIWYTNEYITATNFYVTNYTTGQPLFTSNIVVYGWTQTPPTSPPSWPHTPVTHFSLIIILMLLIITFELRIRRK